MDQTAKSITTVRVSVISDARRETLLQLRHGGHRVLNNSFVVIRHQEETGSPVGSDKVAEEEGEDLEDEEEYDEEEEDDDERPRKKPRHGGFILDEAGTLNTSFSFRFCLHVVSIDLSIEREKEL